VGVGAVHRRGERSTAPAALARQVALPRVAAALGDVGAAGCPRRAGRGREGLWAAPGALHGRQGPSLASSRFRAPLLGPWLRACGLACGLVKHLIGWRIAAEERRSAGLLAAQLVA